MLKISFILVLLAVALSAFPASENDQAKKVDISLNSVETRPQRDIGHHGVGGLHYPPEGPPVPVPEDGIHTLRTSKLFDKLVDGLKKIPIAIGHAVKTIFSLKFDEHHH